MPQLSHAENSPLRIDLITTANTNVPPFYGGRKLPSTGGQLSVSAILSNEDVVNPLNYWYLWKINGKPQNGGTPTRNSTILIETTLESTITASVTITDDQGKILGTKAHTIPIGKPELYFYEVYPLRGLSTQALPKELLHTQEEITIQAGTYFIDATIPTHHFFSKWMVNDALFSEKETNIITLQKSNVGETANVGYKIGNTTEFLQNAYNTIVVKFK